MTRSRALLLLLALPVMAWLSGLVLPLPTASGASADAGRQLAFVDAALARGEAERMQRLFPEGYLFLWVLSGLAHVELGLQAEGKERDGHREATLQALAALDSEAGRAPFSPSTDPPWGVFYVGWTTLLRARLAELGDRDPARLAALEASCMALAAAFRKNPSPFLSAYPGSSWPVDSVVAMAALAARDRALGPRYAEDIAAWLARAVRHLDPQTGLFPHQTDPETGAPIDGARGTSQTLILVFLPELDPALAAAHYAGFKERFVVTRLGLYGVAEYPPERLAEAEAAGEVLQGDVDSGPLILGLSMSASAVAIGTAKRNGDAALADALTHAAELAGVQWGLTQKRALFGQLPVADAFLAWVKAMPPSGASLGPSR